MALGRRKDERQAELWVATHELPRSPGHVFYEKLNGLLAEGGFDAWIENLCEPYYAKTGRPGIPPGVYFRMLLIGYFEGIGSVQVYKRGKSRFWQCSASIAGRQHRTSTREDELPAAKEAAEDWYLTLRGKAKAGLLTNEKTFKDAAEQFLKEYEIITEGHRARAGSRDIKYECGYTCFPFSESAAFRR